MATATTPLASIRLRLDLPTEILARYELEASKRGLTLEELLTERLIACSGHTATRPIYVDDEGRRRLEAFLKKNIRNATDLIRELEKASSLSVAAAHPLLSPELQRRLRSRALGKPFPQFLGDLITQLLEQTVGMR